MTDPPSWTPELVTHSAERSLKLIKTDHLDVLLLHSCSADKVTDELLDALSQAKSKGLTRFIGYSGDGADASKALDHELFDVFETSVNICDQQVLDTNLPKAAEKGLGVITKRTLANVCWRKDKNTSGFYANYVKEYRRRFDQMGITCERVGFDGPMIELALRFAVYQPGVSSGIIGGTNLKHIQQNIKMAEKGPLPEQVIASIRQIWKQNDDGSWTGRQ